MRYLFLFLFVFFQIIKPAAQPGCTDPQALNFDPSAVENDGSCTYPGTLYAPVQIAQLPPALDECSGLAFFGNRLWSHLDAGNLAQLYIIDTLTGALQQTITLPGATNVDWEDLAEDDEHLYVGDFGNNNGNRTDLKILKFKKSGLLTGLPVFETIHFSFSDQVDFTPANNANNYDCEAFFFWDDSLHLFSKNWLDFKTRHYVLPATPGTHVAQLRDSFAVQGQITGADISSDGKAVLLGYNVSTSQTFLWLLFDFPDSRFFAGNRRKITMGSALYVSQVEGIVFRNEHYGYICSERFSTLPQKLLAFDIRQWTAAPNAVVDGRPLPEVTVAPNPFQDFLMLDLINVVPGNIDVSLCDLTGKTLKSWSFGNAGPLRLELPPLPAGVYFLTVQTEAGRVAKMVFKN